MAQLAIAIRDNGTFYIDMRDEFSLADVPIEEIEWISFTGTDGATFLAHTKNIAFLHLQGKAGA